MISADDPFLKMILNCGDLPEMESFQNVTHYNMAVYMYPQVPPLSIPSASDY